VNDEPAPRSCPRRAPGVRLIGISSGTGLMSPMRSVIDVRLDADLKKVAIDGDSEDE
jgi:hypothetical protein